jgi:hypothetical protein
MQRSKIHEPQSRPMNSNSNWDHPSAIRRRSAAIRAGWSEAERAHRRELSQKYAAVWQSLVQ